MASDLSAQNRHTRRRNIGRRRGGPFSSSDLSRCGLGPRSICAMVCYLVCVFHSINDYHHWRGDEQWSCFVKDCTVVAITSYLLRALPSALAQRFWLSRCHQHLRGFCKNVLLRSATLPNATISMKQT